MGLHDSPSGNQRQYWTNASNGKIRKLPTDFFRCCITSPPYWGLRDYNADGQIGAEDDPHDYIKRLVSIFEEVHRVLTADGTLWLNIGDSYTSGNRGYRAPDKKNPVRAMSYRAKTPRGLKPKDLVGIPWRVAFALQETGWYLRSDIIWEKPNCMPESVKDRPTRAHEYIFLFSKSIEIKGGGDLSNIHNRIGEAEKSHQKAKNEGYVECWTMVGVVDSNLDLARRESPTTDRFYHIDQ